MLKDKVALITGGGRGIGLSIALELARNGADIALFDVNADDLNTACERIGEHGVKAIGLNVDVTDFEAVSESVKKVADELGAPVILVNNAGITRDNLLLRMSEAEWSSVISVNLTGTFNVTKACLRGMTRNRWGRIVNIASVVGLMGNAGQANYAASKAGIIGFTKATAKEIAARNVTVNAIAPGYIRTAMTDKLSDEARQTLEGLIPLKRLGEPADVARCVSFLCSCAADYVTGQVLNVDGGMVM
ncbi:MAG: 3-oxoacyl-[acyl-carrier-protein] reductase [Planctomycetota bacterium]|nr:3-oxoacyl-[acyl-carrier-protein] reductase [Planctomycetota bacterium]